MTPIGNITPQTAYLISLLKIDKAKMKARDVVILYTIITHPGISGIEVAHKLGIPERSHIQNALFKMEKMGLIEDHRPDHRRRKANPAIFHATIAGLTLWDSLKP
jgi:DNA-binding MarR family transcriptional regulator